jgi:alkanesulfonate monooxygenase SsuD/methylene tetrahydromethanopterin reductase-like flavin-dependent oxidoreductase (luciferase family)
MRFGVWPTVRQPWAYFLDAAVHAEATGWDGVWVFDHFMPAAGPLDVPTLECWTALTAMAMVVPRVRLGPLVAGNTYRHPAVLATMAATLDHASGGRVVLGLIGGYIEVGVDEFIVPDWNAGRGQARRDFFDWFATEVAAGFP